jgi:5-(carboxyamino)imidazole ribonucleotide mutase
MDALLSIAQMPKGIPVGTLAIGEAGAGNAGLLAAMILALSDEKLSARVIKWREAQTESVALEPQ